MCSATDDLIPWPADGVEWAGQEETIPDDSLPGDPTLEEVEGVMECGMALWLVGLHIVRRERLYREGYVDFQDYASRRWHVSRRHADRMAAAGGLLLDLDPTLLAHERQDRPNGSHGKRTTILPANERQIRPLVALKREGYSPAEIQEVWAEAVVAAHGAQPSAKRVATMADIYAAASLEAPSPQSEGPGIKRRRIEEGCYQLARRVARCDRLAVWVRAAVSDALEFWAQSGGDISILEEPNDHEQ